MIQFLTFSKKKAEDKAGFPLKKRDFHYKSEISITKAGFPLQKRDFHYKVGFPLQSGISITKRDFHYKKSRILRLVIGNLHQRLSKYQF